MKKRLLLLLISAFAVCWQVSAQGPVGCYGKLQVNASTGKIYGSKTGAGTPVQVKGVSFGWNMYPESHPYFTAQMVDRMVDEWKCEIVRAPMATKSDPWNQAYDNAGARNTLNQRMFNVIDRAIARGVYVIIDWHSHQAEQEKSLAIQYFGEMAQKYGKNDHVIFEIYNEPLAQDWNTIRSYAVDVIAEIRKHSTNLILVGTQGYSQMIGAPADNKINDSNVAYVLHIYAQSHSMGTYTAHGNSTFQAQITKALNNRIPIFVTEWGTVRADGAGSHDANSSNTWTKWMDDNDISWCAWQVSHKDEASCFFQNKGNVANQPASWFSNRSNFSASGQYIFDHLNAWSTNSKARWRTNCPGSCTTKYNVTFNTGVTGLTVPTQEICAGQNAFVPEAPKRTGFRFLGWYTSQTGGTVFNFSSAINSATTLYARWEQGGGPTMLADCDNDMTNMCTPWWSFDDGLGSKVTAATDLDGNLKITPTGGQKGGHMTVTYATGAQGSGTGANYDIWGCGIGFNLNSASSATKDEPADLTGAMSISFYHKGDAAEIQLKVLGKPTGYPNFVAPILAHTNWTLVEIDMSTFAVPDWHTDAGTKLSATDLKNVASIQFQFSAKAAAQTGRSFGVDEIQLNGIDLPACDGCTEVTVTFASAGGSTVAPVTTCDDKPVAKPADPTRAGYDFLGWFNGSTKITFPYLATANVTLTAQWELVTCTQYTATFNSAGGSAVASAMACQGGSIAAPAEPTRPGYKFLGWFNGASKVNFPYTMGTANVTFTAQWEEDRDPNSPTLIADCEDENVTKLLTYWYSYQAGSSTITPLTTPTSPFTMTAPGANGTGYAAVASGNLVNTAAPAYESCGIGFHFNDTETDYDLTGATGISFWHKGAAVNFSVMLSTVTPDAGLDYSFMVPAHTNWTLVTVAFPGADITSNGILSQPDWAPATEVKPWDPSKVTKLQWQVKDGVARAYEFGIDEVTVLGKALTLPKKPEGADKTALTAAVASANASYSAAIEGSGVGQYQTGSKATFLTAINAAQAVVDNAAATQADVDAAAAALQTAVQAFENAKVTDPGVNKAALAAALANANSLHTAAIEGTAEGHYEVGSKAPFLQAINAATTTHNDAAATQAHVDAAVAALQSAVSTFQSKLIRDNSPHTLIADCEGENGNQTKLFTYWYSYQAGESTITPLTTPTSPFVMTAPGANGTGYAAVASGNLVNTAAPAYESCGIGFHFNETETDYDLTDATGISFWHKGAAVNFSVMLSTVTPDAGLDYSFMVPAHANWTLVTVAFPGADITSNGILSQPDWAPATEVKPWDASKVTKLQWQVKDGVARAFEFGIDEVSVLDKKLSLPVGVAAVESVAFGIYPNPTKGGNFNVSLAGNNSALLSIINLQGQVVYSAEVSNGAAINTNLGAGVYVVSVQTANGVQTQKLIVK